MSKSTVTQENYKADDSKEYLHEAVGISPDALSTKQASVTTRILSGEVNNLADVSQVLNDEFSYDEILFMATQQLSTMIQKVNNPLEALIAMMDKKGDA